MDALIVGFLFLMFGLTFFLLVIFKYTEKAHWQEVEKWGWIQEHKYVDPEMSLFHRIASKSFIIAKAILLLTALIPTAIGIFAIWVYFGA